MSQDRKYHRPVLADEVVGLMRPERGGVIVDATFGGGGHSRRMLSAMEKPLRIIGIDRDPDARDNAAAIGLEFLAGDFASIVPLLERAGVERVDGVLMDLGVSSHQFDSPERGFSYRHPGPLDMRMDPSTPLTADEVVNRWTAPRLAEALRRFGEVQAADRIVRAIVAARPLRDTAQLARVVADATPAALRRRGHPARKVFQAIRVAVNGELESLAQGLDGAVSVLGEGGRIVVISYHSLEDRIVKDRFRRGSEGCVCPPGLPVCACGHSAELRILTRKPVTPSAPEIAGNPRARSAKLRAAEKVAA